MEDKFHAVIDTNVIVSALISKNLEATINGWTNLNNKVEIITFKNVYKMKKMTKLFVLALLAGAMVSCSTEDTAPSTQNDKVAVQFTGSISVNTSAAGTASLGRCNQRGC